MEPVLIEGLAAGGGAAASLILVLSVFGFAAGLAAVVASLGDARVLSVTVVRRVSVGMCGGLVVLSLFGLAPGGVLALSTVGFLLGLEAVAVEFGSPRSLRSYLAPGRPVGEPAWWAEFERGFRRYAGYRRREQNPLKRAVTRPSDRAGSSSGMKPADGSRNAPGARA